ncbi:MAG TPA: hypothetical protein VM890_00670, partial [Longimicrobium sp.]|nr:hypothetical protein [Longimicrobium sp.]
LGEPGDEPLAAFEGDGNGEPVQIDRSGKQDNIQKKMAQLVKMYSQSLGHGVESPWATDVILNGLCGGWVEIFKKYPAWIGELWAALKDWQVPGDWEDGDPRPLLDGLNGLIEQYATEASGIGSVQGQEAYLQVIQLLREAWKEMAELEPEAGYELDAMPAFTEGIQTGLGDPAALVLQTTIPETETDAPAEYITGEIRSYTEKQLEEREVVELVAHVETNEHHMAVRVRATADAVSITVVETENLGIATFSSWDELPAYLSGGFFLGGDPAQTEEEVEIKLYAPPA